MGLRCGIDLGTTYSSISWYDEYNRRVETIELETADGERVLRSVVYYPEGDAEPVVGEAAWNAARKYPERVIVGIKRAMGADYKTPSIDGVQHSPAEVSAEILKTLVKDAEIILGEKITDVVITIPAYFGDAERAATEEAGKLAGLNVLGLLPEPHAAALAYAVDHATDITDRKLLVYDLGGGTFDATLIHAYKKSGADGATSLQVDTLCKDGNRELGGLDWDRALAELVGERIRDLHGVDVWQDAGNQAILLDNCEKAKRRLTRLNNTSVVADAANHECDITRADFEDRTRDLLLHTQMLVERVLADQAAARSKAEGRDYTVEEVKQEIEVMITGGSSRMPMVRAMLEGLLGRPPLLHGNPELQVTRGAAYWAYLLQPGREIVVSGPDENGNPTETTIPSGGLAVIDSAPYSVGLRAMRAVGNGQFEAYNSVVLRSGAKYGETFEKVYETTEAGMTEIELVIYKGDSPKVEECDVLKTLMLTGLPPGRPAGRPVRVTLQYDQSGILRGSALDVDTNEAVEIVVDRH